MKHRNVLSMFWKNTRSKMFSGKYLRPGRKSIEVGESHGENKWKVI